jgi:fermentation-respiration switch protein FrsA (DUF1100 family)
VPRPVGDRYAALEDVTLEAADGVTLRAWHWPAKNRPTLLFFHGNAGHRGHRLDWIERFHDLGWGVFILDYRGYGGSAGTPTQDGLLKDGAAAVTWLEAKGTERIVYFGESIGCGVAVFLAAQRPPAALVLQAGAQSLADVGQNAYPILPIRWIMKDSFDCTEPQQSVQCPVLSIHGEHDRIVPIGLGRDLYEGFPGANKEWYVVAKAGHNDLPWVGGRAYYERVHAFLAEATAR